MTVPQPVTASDIWIDQIFSAASVHKGGVVWRNRAWVEREIGFDRFYLEARSRGFHMIECGP